MNIIVTGAGRGIGYQLVKLLSADSKHTVVAISRNAEQLKKLKDECLSDNSASNMIPIVCNLSYKNSMENVITQLKNQINSIHILINNAGAIVNKPFEQITTADLEHVYNVNVFSVVRLIQDLLPIMDTVQRSHIINISSMGGFQGSTKFAGLSAYSSSKAALACLTECLAEEFKEKNIAFNCLALGAVQTEMLSEAFPGYKAPLTADKMAEFIADFSLNGHKYMNGKIIPVSLSTP